MANAEKTPTTAAAADADKPKRTRTKSAFRQTIRFALFGHAKVLASLPSAKELGEAVVAAGILNGPDTDNPNATRVVTRTRKGSKSTIHSVSVYVAANGFEFSDAAIGVRIATDTWDALRPQLEALGLTADEEGLKKLAAILAANAPAAAPAAS